MAVTVTEKWTFQDDVRIPTGHLQPPRPRSEMEQRQLVSKLLAPMGWRVWDAFATVLPGTSASDDLGLVGGTWGTGTPSLQTWDVKAAGTSTLYARRVEQLPMEYDDHETVALRFHAGMLTSIAGTSAQIDVEVFKSNGEAGVDGADLCITAAVTINSLTLADKDFIIDAAGLVPGDVLDIRVKIVIVDASTVTTVKGIIGRSELLYDARG